MSLQVTRSDGPPQFPLFTRTFFPTRSLSEGVFLLLFVVHKLYLAEELGNVWYVFGEYY